MTSYIIDPIFILAQASVITEAAKIASESASRDFSYWFAFAFALLVISGTAVFKWLIKQNADQRTAHTEINTKLVEYLANDRKEMLIVMSRTTSILERLETKIGT